MKLKYFLVPVIAFVTCATMQAQTSGATSSPNPESDHQDHWRHHHHAWIWNKLNLTDAQKTQIKSIRQGLKGQFRPALAAVLSARLKLQQDVSQNNQSAITTDSASLANAIAQLATIRANELSQVKAVLNQDQLTTLNDLQQKRQTRMQDRVNKLNQPTS
jgi:Spy/CpxP family protein refolding chaperone